MTAYAIVTRENPEPQPIDFDHDDNYDNWKAKDADAAFMIWHSCSPEVQRIVKGIRNPHEMWNILETRLDTAGSYIGRQDILPQFPACQPKEDEPLKAYFTKLSNYRIQLDHTNYAVTDRDFRMQIFSRGCCVGGNISDDFGRPCGLLYMAQMYPAVRTSWPCDWHCFVVDLRNTNTKWHDIYWMMRWMQQNSGSDVTEKAIVKPGEYRFCCKRMQEGWCGIQVAKCTAYLTSTPVNLQYGGEFAETPQSIMILC